MRFLYDRLAGYFPQLDETDVSGAHATATMRSGAGSCSAPGACSQNKRQIERGTDAGRSRRRAQARRATKGQQFSLAEDARDSAQRRQQLSHGDMQQMLLDIGRVLGYHAESEFEYYDVVWRASESSPRLSHVFEVQHKGNIDAALAKLKRAYEAQRSKPFLIVASERDTNRANKHMSQARTGAFHEIGRVTVDPQLRATATVFTAPSPRSKTCSRKSSSDDGHSHHSAP